MEQMEGRCEAGLCVTVSRYIPPTSGNQHYFECGGCFGFFLVWFVVFLSGYSLIMLLLFINQDNSISIASAMLLSSKGIYSEALVQDPN